MGLTVYGGGGKPEEEKTVTAGTSAIEVSPSSGKAMKKVTVNPTPSQSKTVTPSTSQQTVSPDSGKLLSKVIVKAMEDVTPEVTAQTPVITQILEGLVGKAQGANATADKILEGYSAYVGQELIEGTYKPIDVAALFGCTKYAVDKFTLTSDVVASGNYISHSLGVIPLFALLITVDASTNSNYIKYAIIIGGNGTNPNIGLYAYRSMQTNDGFYGVTNIFEDKLRINYGSTSYKAGIEYTLITMA